MLEIAKREAMEISIYLKSYFLSMDVGWLIARSFLVAVIGFSRLCRQVLWLSVGQHQLGLAVKVFGKVALDFGSWCYSPLILRLT